MAIGNMDLYRALKEAGASDEAAAAAAKSVVRQLPGSRALSGVLVAIAALNLGMLGVVFHIGGRLPSREAPVTRVAQYEPGPEQRATNIEQGLQAIEEQGAARHAEIMRQLELLRREPSAGEP